ncbi:WXG100 family type VII secretion target [Rathayibacter sp. VKM Ac-2857]|uniref:WXG100 family type VII secretion target n=1 Tax=Rathayibacter sp. VKM Ac-2857 TaxID=2739020 RepID=UPI00156786DD|nr:WXG100 family type VII secretion target [Rathayibacter sp. VKM Ac-2857]NQX16049.1 WXG100 family type VII secretion target [Rathayibacter sp. VKM Ac-2857]
MAELRSLARQLQSASDRLDGARQRIGSGIRISAWVGPVAVRFRMMWDSEYSRQVQNASDALERIAGEILRNAVEQERASAPDGGAGGPSGIRLPPGNIWRGGDGLIPVPGRLTPGSHWTLESLKGILESLGLVESAVSVLEWARILQETQLIRGSTFTGPALGKFLLPVGAVLSIIGTAEAIEKGDVVGALLEGGSGAVSTGLGVAAVVVGGTAAVGLGVVGAGVVALVGVISVGLPFSPEMQDAAYRQAVRDRFGPGVDADALTNGQAETMRRRYEGVLGVPSMISDTMRASGEPARKAIEDGGYWIGGVAENTKEYLKNVFRR